MHREKRKRKAEPMSCCMRLVSKREREGWRKDKKAGETYVTPETLMTMLTVSVPLSFSATTVYLPPASGLGFLITKVCTVSSLMICYEMK